MYPLPKKEKKRWSSIYCIIKVRYNKAFLSAKVNGAPFRQDISRIVKKEEFSAEVPIILLSDKSHFRENPARFYVDVFRWTVALTSNSFCF